MLKPMNKSTEKEMRGLILSIDSKLNGLVEQTSSINRQLELLVQEVSIIKTDVAKLDNRLWAFGGLLLAACLGTLFKILNF